MLFSFLFLLLFLPSAVRPFTFSTTIPTQCDPLTVAWNGGTPPLSIILFPVFGSPHNFSVPSSAAQNAQGNFSFLLPIAAKQRVVVVMSDATGFATGGSTPLLTVGPSVTGVSCNTTDPGPEFYFDLDGALNQCESYSISNYTGAVEPVTIIGIIPGGTSFVINPPANQTNYTWTANVAAYTSILFSMFDAEGHNGGISDVKTVGQTAFSTCLNGQSPSSVASSATLISSTLSPTSSATGMSKSSFSTAALVGTVVGSVVGTLMLLAVLGALLAFCIRKNDRQRAPDTSIPAYATGSPFSNATIPTLPTTAAGTTSTQMQYMPHMPVTAVHGVQAYDHNPFADSASHSPPFPSVVALPAGASSPYTTAYYQQGGAQALARHPSEVTLPAQHPQPQMVPMDTPGLGPGESLYNPYFQAAVAPAPNLPNSSFTASRTQLTSHRDGVAPPPQYSEGLRLGPLGTTPRARAHSSGASASGSRSGSRPGTGEAVALTGKLGLVTMT